MSTPVTVKLPDILAGQLKEIANAAEVTITDYVTKAIKAQVMRDQFERYQQALAADPELAAEHDRAKRFMYAQAQNNVRRAAKLAKTTDAAAKG